MEVAEVPYSDSIKIEPILDGNDTISQDGNETMLSDEEKGNLIHIWRSRVACSLDIIFMASSLAGIQGDPSGLLQPPVELDLGCSTIRPGQGSKQLQKWPTGCQNCQN